VSARLRRRLTRYALYERLTADEKIAIYGAETALR
jgi:hypothetical protein